MKKGKKNKPQSSKKEVTNQCKKKHKLAKKSTNVNLSNKTKQPSKMK